MKNWGSTASKSLAERTSVVQQNHVMLPSSQYFSVRGYVAEMKVKTPEACNPFCGYENSVILQEQLQLGPLDVPKHNSSLEHREAGALDNRGPPYGQAVLIQRNPQQRRNISSCNLDLSLSLCCPGTESTHKVGDEGISVENPGKRKGIVDALADNRVSALKSRRLIEMGKFLETPFTSCEIIDLESPSFRTHGSTRPLATTFNANHGQKFVEPLETRNAKGRFPFSENAGPMSTKYANALKRDVLDLATRPMSRPLNSIDEVCVINKNPADFNAACDPGNIYTR